VSTSITDTVDTSEELVLRWQVHLAKNQPKRFAGLIAAAVGLALLAYMWFGSPIPAVIMAFVFFGALSDFLLPVTYTLTATHASASTLVGKRVMAWKDVRKCYLDDYGVKLSPLRRRSRLEAYRGVYLRFGDRREEVLDAVKKLRPQNV
jgi:hypothetical protein